MSSTLEQVSFTTGEISPSLYGRVDIQKYASSLKLCKNFMVMPFGGAKNRAGFRYITSTASNKAARLIPFRYSTNDNYILEFTAGEMRVFRNGFIVLNSSGPNVGQPFVLVTPFTNAEIPNLTFAQSADVMIYCSKTRKQQQLTRFGHDNWTITDMSFLPKVSPPATATAVATSGSGTTQKWRYQVTAVVDDGSNSIDESLPVTSNQITVFASTYQGDVSYPAVVGATYYNIYKDNAGSGIYGFIGRSVNLTFTDENITPVKTDTPPTGNDPFVGDGNYPAAVGYYQQRLTFGGTTVRPQTLWFSKTGLPNNFGYSIPSKDDDAITWTMASTQINRIKHLMPLTSLLTFTDGAEWSIEGGTSGLSSKTINGNPQTYNGIGVVPPLVINNAILYAQEQGTEVTAFSYNYDSDGFIGSDANIMARHLLEDYSIKEWAYQKIPYSIIWAVRSDGVLLGLTYNKEQQVVAWHHHATDGFFESVASVPEGREYAVYVVVRRIVNGLTYRYVERMDTRNLPLKNGKPDIAKAFFVDSGLTYNGANTNTNLKIRITGGINWAYPEVLTCTKTGGNWSTLDVGKQIQIEVGTNDPLRMNIVGYVSPTVVSVTPLGTVPPAYRDANITAFSIAVTLLTGLSHLEGKTLSVLGDGNVLPKVVVSGGSITVSQPCAYLSAGLPITSDLQTLEVTTATKTESSLLSTRKLINSLIVMVEESRGIWAGQDEKNLWEFKQRDDEAMAEPTQTLTGKAQIYISADWASQGNVFIRQEDPLPLTVNAVLPEVVMGGKI